MGGSAAAKRKVLIVKTGYSETLRCENSTACSLGDVFRTTAILHLFYNDQVTWLTDTSAVALLDGNPFVFRVLAFNLLAIQQLQSERYDVVVNLEKIPGVCAMSERIKTGTFYGFEFNPETGTAKADELSARTLSIALKNSGKQDNTQSLERILYAILGAEWRGEQPILPFEPRSSSYDVGLNKYVGTKYPSKAWPMKYWGRLEGLLEKGISISHQSHLHNLHSYMQWVASSRMLITSDTLGLHLGLAMRRRVLALMGPTSVTEIPTSENLVIITPDLNRDCMPCCTSNCRNGYPCMRYIRPESVSDRVAKWRLS